MGLSHETDEPRVRATTGAIIGGVTTNEGFVQYRGELSVVGYPVR